MTYAAQHSNPEAGNFSAMQPYEVTTPLNTSVPKQYRDGTETFATYSVE